MRLAIARRIFCHHPLVGLLHAPHFKNLKRQRLYIFKNRQKGRRSTWQSNPTGYCDNRARLQYWDDILYNTGFIIATIKPRRRPPPIIFRRRLTPTSQRTDSIKPLKAFGQILKSHFILRVIDSRAAYRHRKSAQWSPNYTTVSRGGGCPVGNPREFFAAEKQEQEMAEPCSPAYKTASSAGTISTNPIS